MVKWAKILKMGACQKNKDHVKLDKMAPVTEPFLNCTKFRNTDKTDNADFHRSHLYPFRSARSGASVFTTSKNLLKYFIMILRVARHTNNLQAITKFYTDIIGLHILGSFNNHAGYNGIFLGKEKWNWHLELTESGEKSAAVPDADDLLVFYPSTQLEYDAIMQRIEAGGIEKLVARNPYWRENGVLVRDMDGFGVMISHNKFSL